MTEYNVSESDGTVEVVLVANGTSEFDYTVNLTVYDVTTGECVCVCVRACVYVCNHLSLCPYDEYNIRMYLCVIRN